MNTLRRSFVCVCVVCLGAGSTALAQSSEALENATVSNDSAQPAQPEPIPAPPQTDQHPEKPLRLRVGGYLGFAKPLGDISDNTSFSDTARSAVPIGIEATAMHKTGWGLGVYLHFAFGQGATQFKQDCSDCSIFGYAFGLKLERHFVPRGTVDPWFALGAGWEHLAANREFEAVGVTSSGATRKVHATSSTTLSAFPELSVQLGVEFGAERLRIGPFVSATVSSYTDVDVKLTCRDFGCPDELAHASSDVEGTAYHSWISVGVRGSYVL